MEYGIAIGLLHDDRCWFYGVVDRVVPDEGALLAVGSLVLEVIGVTADPSDDTLYRVQCVTEFPVTESQLRKRGWKLIAESVGGRWRSVTQVEEVAV